MKKLWVILLAWCCLLYGGCGSQDTDTEIYYDIESETEELKFPVELGDMFLGAQFWQGEPVLLIKRFSDGFLQNIYLCRRDGSRELLVSGLADDDSKFVNATYEGYVDQDKNCYFYYTTWPEMNGEYTPISTVIKTLPTGEIQYPGNRIQNRGYLPDRGRQALSAVAGIQGRKRGSGTI
mgnify:CR=1 FL=1